MNSNPKVPVVPTVWWCVFNPYPTGKKPLVRHETKEAAVSEAQRLAHKEGRKMHVLRCEGTAYPAVYFDREAEVPCIW